MRRTIFLIVSTFIMIPILVGADIDTNTTPTIIVEDGMTQPVFSKEESIVESVFVETTIDSDGDGEDDLVRADIIRPKETEEGLKVPVIYEMSPYRAGLNPIDFLDVDVELNPVGDDDSEGKHFASDLVGYYDDYFLPLCYAC